MVEAVREYWLIEEKVSGNFWSTLAGPYGTEQEGLREFAAIDKDYRPGKYRLVMVTFALRATTTVFQSVPAT